MEAWLTRYDFEAINLNLQDANRRIAVLEDGLEAIQERLNGHSPPTTETGELRLNRYLHNRIAYRFDKSELSELAHWFGINPDDLEGERHTDKVLSFVMHLQRRGKTLQLIERLEQLRPNEEWRTE